MKEGFIVIRDFSSKSRQFSEQEAALPLGSNLAGNLQTLKGDRLRTSTGGTLFTDFFDGPSSNF